MQFSFPTASKPFSDLTNQERSSEPVNLLEGNYIETALFSLFKLDIVNFIRVKVILAKEFHIQPSEIEKFPAWEFEIFMKELNDIVKEENDKQKKEMDKAGVNDAKKMSDPRYIERMQQNAIPKMPEMPKMPNNITIGGGFK